MSYHAAGVDGLILRLGGEMTMSDWPWARGISREKFDGTKTLNGVGRTQIPGEDSERFVAVGDDGEVRIRSGKSGKWIRSSTGFSRDLNAVAIARGTRAAWAVGDEGTVLRTTDGGKNWGKQSSHTTRHLRAVVAVTKDRAWAVGDEGELHATDDAGVTWRRKSVSGVSKHLRGICAGAELRVAVGDDGALVYRYKGNWGHAEITGKHLRAVAISPSGRVVAVGDDGWIGTRKPAAFGGNEASRWKSRTDVTSRHLRGVIAHDDEHWAIVGDGEFLTSNDGGSSWNRRGGMQARLNAVC